MRNFYKKNYLLQLKGFCALMEEKTIEKAANKLNTVHSNISLQIKALEKDTNLKLFNKEGKFLVPTQEAREFYQSAKKILNDFEDLFDVKAKNLKAKNDNLIKIAGHSYAFSHLLIPYFHEMIKINPDIKFELNSSTREEAFILMENKTVDFIVFPIPLNVYNNQDLIIKDFYKCEFGLNIYPGHPLEKIDGKDLTWETILKYEYIQLNKNNTAQGTENKIFNNNSIFTLFNGNWEIVRCLIKNKLTTAGGDKNYTETEDIKKEIIFKSCPHLLPNYKFSICFFKKIKFNDNIKQFINLMPNIE